MNYGNDGHDESVRGRLRALRERISEEEVNTIPVGWEQVEEGKFIEETYTQNELHKRNGKYLYIRQDGSFQIKHLIRKFDVLDPDEQDPSYGWKQVEQNTFLEAIHESPEIHLNYQKHDGSYMKADGDDAQYWIRNVQPQNENPDNDKWEEVRHKDFLKILKGTAAEIKKHVHENHFMKMGEKYLKKKQDMLHGGGLARMKRMKHDLLSAEMRTGVRDVNARRAFNAALRRFRNA